jgi:hypothetical protein
LPTTGSDAALQDVVALTRLFDASYLDVRDGLLVIDAFDCSASATIARGKVQGNEEFTAVLRKFDFAVYLLASTVNAACSRRVAPKP